MVSLSLLPLPLFLLPWLSLAIHIELQRRNTLQGRSIDFLKEAQRLRYHYGFTPTTISNRGKREAAPIPMSNQYSDTSYIASMSIGTPPQPLLMTLGTGSSDLWVASTSCTSCSQSTTIFNSTASSTFISSPSTSPVSIFYGGGNVSGITAQDTVSMGGFTLGGQTLLSATNVSSGIINGRVSGVMGLAWSSLAFTRANPFWYNLVINNVLTSPDMSFWLTREIDNSRSTVQTFGGIFTLGGINDTLYTGNIEFVQMPVTTPSYWLLGLSSITINGSPISVQTGSSALAAFDIGTTLIGGPSSDIAKIWAAVPGAAPSTQGYYAFPCDTKVTVTMAFGGSSWTINPADINLGPVNSTSNLCTGAFFDMNLGSPGAGHPTWVIGDTFLKNVYTVLRASPPSIGFGQLSAAASGSGQDGSNTAAPTGGTPSKSGTGSISSSSMPAFMMCATTLVLSTVIRLFDFL